MRKGLVSVVVGLVAVAATACSGGTGDAAEVGTTGSAATTATTFPYLALGDSIAFGDDGYVSWTDPTRKDATNFVGYPFQVAQTLYGSSAKVYDLACPGETTGSFSDATAKDNGCREYRFTDQDQLHESYSGTQQEAALAFLAAHPETKLVSITLGGNDLLLAEYACNAASNFYTCVIESIPGVLATAAKNVGAIVDTIRGAGYRGDIVYLTQYATNYTDATQLAAIPAFNTAVGAAVIAHGGKVVSGFDTFAAASVFYGGDPCKAGLLIPNPDGTATCDKHPSTKGRNLLADAVVFGH